MLSDGDKLVTGHLPADKLVTGLSLLLPAGFTLDIVGRAETVICAHLPRSLHRASSRTLPAGSPVPEYVAYVFILILATI